MRYVPALVLFLTAFSPANAADAPSTEKPASDLPIIYSQDFEDGGGSDFQARNPMAFKIVEQDGNRVMSQFQNLPGPTPVRSPFNRAILQVAVVSDFQFDVDLQSTARDYPHRSLCLFFGYRDPSHFYYVHFGQRTDDHANQIFIVNEADRTKISTKTTPGTPWDNNWHHARIKRNAESGSIEIYFDDMEAPVMTANDKTFPTGRVGIGSFDDTGNFDNLWLFGKKAN